ncbi:hypothetical protein AAVH_24141 [Aphelenchoides avenae]|nr:hypothetical protein AAVH_24141 [Aphelenchus avenae]
MYALLASALFLRAATTASSVDWMPEEERLMVHEFANWTGLLRINASSLAKHNMLAITLLCFVKDVDDAKPSNDQGIVSG